MFIKLGDRIVNINHIIAIRVYPKGASIILTEDLTFDINAEEYKLLYKFIFKNARVVSGQGE